MQWSVLVGLLLVTSVIVGSSVVGHGVAGSTKPIGSQLTAGVWVSGLVISIVSYLQVLAGAGLWFECVCVCMCVCERGACCRMVCSGSACVHPCGCWPHVT